MAYETIDATPATAPTTTPWKPKHVAITEENHAWLQATARKHGKSMQRLLNDDILGQLRQKRPSQ